MCPCALDESSLNIRRVKVGLIREYRIILRCLHMYNSAMSYLSIVPGEVTHKLHQFQLVVGEAGSAEDARHAACVQAREQVHLAPTQEVQNRPNEETLRNRATQVLLHLLHNVPWWQRNKQQRQAGDKLCKQVIVKHVHNCN